MAIVIRTLYHNQDWAAPCREPYTDIYCQYCRRGTGLAITPPSPGVRVCDGMCWEQTLRIDCEWGCTPAGTVWGRRLEVNDRVFFVYREPKHFGQLTYAIWGATHVVGIDGDLRAKLVDDHLYNFMQVAPFKAIPAAARPSSLTDRQLVGGFWGSSAFRYIWDPLESELLSMIPDGYVF